jgi:hypothetical protein
MPRDMPGEKFSSFVTDSKLRQVITQIRSSEIPLSRLVFIRERNFQRGIGIFYSGTWFLKLKNTKRHQIGDRQRHTLITSIG